MAIEIHFGNMELKRNVLKFGYAINYKYEGTLSHSFDRFYVVTKFELLKVEYLKLMTISYDSDCKYLGDTKSRRDYLIELIKEMKIYCAKIALHIAFYKKQTDYYNWTAYEIITNELASILPMLHIVLYVIIILIIFNILWFYVINYNITKYVVKNYSYFIQIISVIW